MPKKKPPTSPTPAAGAEQTYRRIQRAQIRTDAARGKPRQPAPGSEPVQTGLVDYPANPLPRQRLPKPGREKALDVAPRYLAPHYVGSRKLQDMVALITGGDSGIGRAVAVLFSREGCDVAVVYLRSEQADAEATRQAVENEGRRCLLLPGDVRRTAFCERAVGRTVKTFGKLDILVNNAAFQLHADRLEDLSDERILLTLNTNVAGYMRMARAALPHLQRGACIINSGSRTGLSGSRFLLDYSASKRAIHAFTKALAQNVLDRAAFASTPWHPARCGHPSIRPTSGHRTSPNSAPTPRFADRRNRRSCRPPTCSWPRRSRPATSPAWCCR